MFIILIQYYPPYYLTNPSTKTAKVQGEVIVVTHCRVLLIIEQYVKTGNVNYQGILMKNVGHFTKKQTIVKIPYCLSIIVVKRKIFFAF